MNKRVYISESWHPFQIIQNSAGFYAITIDHYRRRTLIYTRFMNARIAGITDNWETAKILPRIKS